MEIIQPPRPGETILEKDWDKLYETIHKYYMVYKKDVGQYLSKVRIQQKYMEQKGKVLEVVNAPSVEFYIRRD